MGQEPEELRADIEARRDRMSETVDAIGDRVSPTRIAQRRVERTKGWVGGVRERVMGGVDQLTPSGDGIDASGKAHEMADKVSDAPAMVARGTQGSPLVAGALAFGLGVLVASLLPETESEQRVAAQVQPQIEAATDSVKSAAQDTLQTAKASAQDAAGELKESATAKAQDLKDQATDSAQTLKDSVGSSGSE